MNYRSIFLPMTVLMVCSLMPLSAFATPKAKLQVYPTRLTIAGGENSASLNIINSGSATGRYRAELVDLVMPEEGVLKTPAEGQTKEFSAKDMLRVTPRSINVPPGQSQKFRLLARIPRDLPDGEYRSHVSVMMSSENVEAPAQAPQVGVGFSVRPRIRLSVPVVLMKGKTSFTAAIESLEIVPPVNTKNSPLLRVVMTSQGNRSAQGEFVVTFQKGGQVHELYRASGFTVYRGTPRRIQNIGLEVPEGMTLSGGTLKAQYLDEEKNEGAVLAEKNLQL